MTGMAWYWVSQWLPDINQTGTFNRGKIEPQKADSPTLTTNNIGRHISRMAYLKVVSNLSPWLRKAELGGVYCNPMPMVKDVS